MNGAAFNGTGPRVPPGVTLPLGLLDEERSKYLPVLSSPEEVTASPIGERWYRESVRKWVSELEGVSPLTRRKYRETLFCVPDHVERLGFARPLRPSDYSSEMVEALSRDPSLAPTTRTTYLGILHHFLRAQGAPLAESRRAWRLPAWVATRRDWATKEALSYVLSAAIGRERIAVALAGYNGLRSEEIRSLRVSGARMDLPDPRLVFPGKGDKVRDIPMSRQTWKELLPIVTGKKPEDRVYPFGRTTLNRDVALACHRAGVRRYRPHDLRRTFGRLAYYSGATLTAIQGLYGHSSIEETAYYIGLDRDAMRGGIDGFSAYMDPEEAR
jgi:integrase